MCSFYMPMTPARRAQASTVWKKNAPDGKPFDRMQTPRLGASDLCGGERGKMARRRRGV
jgi:hypothetical protein